MKWTAMKTCEHEWGEKVEVKDKNFGVVFGVYRPCLKCSAVLYSDHTRGRWGAPWEVIYPKKGD
jgi:hypothetical protein